MGSTTPRLLHALAVVLVAWVCDAAYAPKPQPSAPVPPSNGNPCRNSSFSALPFCDPTKTVDARVDDLLHRLTLAEKITQLTTGNGVNGGTSDNALPRMGIPRYDWWSEGTHGVKGAYNAGPHTNFALPITTAMAFNRTLWSKTAQQIAREARSWYNEGNLALTYWTPVINLARDLLPRSLMSYTTAPCDPNV